MSIERNAHYTSRVGARTELSEAIKKDHMARAEEAGLVATDLDDIINQGHAAKQADREQKDELAEIALKRSMKAENTEDCIEADGKLRNRMLAAIADVAVAHPEIAGWATRVTFAVYRLVELKGSAEKALDKDGKPVVVTTEEQDLVKKVKREERQDLPTRLGGIAAFAQALLKPGREPLVAALEKRKFSKAQLEKLAADADALSTLAGNQMRAAEATAREAAAVTAQREAWAKFRRMIVEVVEGDAELGRLLAKC